MTETTPEQTTLQKHKKKIVGGVAALAAAGGLLTFSINKNTDTSTKGDGNTTITADVVNDSSTKIGDVTTQGDVSIGGSAGSSK